MEESDREYIKEHFSRISSIAAVIQSEIAIAIKDTNPEIIEYSKDLADGPEDKVMEAMNQQLSGVVNTMPLACIYGTNLITTLLSVHSEMTGDTTIIDAINKNNEYQSDQL